MDFKEITERTKKIANDFPGKEWKPEVRMLDLVEEVGELCNAILVKEGHKGSTRAKSDLADSIADILFDLILIADSYNIDIDKEYSKMIKDIIKRQKENDFI